MTESNKGRFKLADEAQAVWNMVKDKPSIMRRASPFSKVFLSFFDYEVEQMAKTLHKARLINGSIYDEHGRIEDKDVAHVVAKDVYKFKSVRDEQTCNIFVTPVVTSLLRHGKIKGTIFY